MKLNIIKGAYPNKKEVNTENEFFGNGWSVKKEGNKYYLEFISGSLQGELKKNEISESDFDDAKRKKIGLDELCIKYSIS